MELRTLRYFVAVLEAGSLSRAAATLYVAQPALTAQIKKLEAELNVRLFERSHAGITATEAGMRFYQDACRLLSDAAAMQARATHPTSGIEGSVTLAVPFLLSTLLMGSFLAGLSKLHPRIRVFVIDGLSLAVKKAMTDGRAEIGVLVDPGEVKTLDCMAIARDDMYVQGEDTTGEVDAMLLQDTVPAPRGWPAHALPFDKAVKLPLILQSRRYSLRQIVEVAASDRDVVLNVVHEHDSARVIRSLFLAGAGFTFSPACAMAEPPTQTKGWVCARIIDPTLVRNYVLATRADRSLDAAAQAVLDALRRHIIRSIESGVWCAHLGEGVDRS